MLRKMFYKITAALLIVFMCASVCPSMATAAESTDTLTVTGTYDYGKAYEVLNLVNQEREAQGLSDLAMDQELMDAAMQRAAECSLYTSHTRPSGEQCFTVSSKACAENIAAGYATASSVMAGWMGSSGHRANILEGNSRSIGIGCFIQGNTVYWVQLFGTGEAATAAHPDNRGVTVSIAVNPSIFSGYLSLKISASEIDAGTTATVSVRLANPGGEGFSTVLDSNQFVWSSSSEAAVVDASGTVTGRSGGTAEITARTPLGTLAASTTVAVRGVEAVEEPTPEYEPENETPEDEITEAEPEDAAQDDEIAEAEPEDDMSEAEPEDAAQDEDITEEDPEDAAQEDEMAEVEPEDDMPEAEPENDIPEAEPEDAMPEAEPEDAAQDDDMPEEDDITEAEPEDEAQEDDIPEAEPEDEAQDEDMPEEDQDDMVQLDEPAAVTSISTAEYPYGFSVTVWSQTATYKTDSQYSIRNGDGSSTYSVYFYYGGEEDWLDNNVTFEVEDVTPTAYRNMFQSMGVGSGYTVSVTSAADRISSYKRMGYTINIQEPFTSDGPGAHSAAAESGKLVTVETDAGVRALKVSAVKDGEVLDYIYLCSNGKDSSGNYSEYDQELSRKVRRTVESQLWTEDMTNLEKLRAVASYINSTTHYPGTEATSKTSNPSFWENWAVDGVNLFYNMANDVILNQIMKMQGGITDCLAAQLLVDIAEEDLGLPYLYDSGTDTVASGEGVWLTVGSSSSNPSNPYHYSLKYQDSNGNTAFVDAQGMDSTCSVHDCTSKIISLAGAANMDGGTGGTGGEDTSDEEDTDTGEDTDTEDDTDTDEDDIDADEDGTGTEDDTDTDEDGTGTETNDIPEGYVDSDGQWEMYPDHITIVPGTSQTFKPVVRRYSEEYPDGLEIDYEFDTDAFGYLEGYLVGTDGEQTSLTEEEMAGLVQWEFTPEGSIKITVEKLDPEYESAVIDFAMKLYGNADWLEDENAQWSWETQFELIAAQEDADGELTETDDSDSDIGGSNYVDIDSDINIQNETNAEIYNISNEAIVAPIFGNITAPFSNIYEDDPYDESYNEVLSVHPKTGDSNTILIYLVIAAIACGGIAGIVIFRRRRFS